MKNEYGEKLDSNRYAPSIMQWNAGEQCAFCGREHVEVVRHEIFPGHGRREKCKQYGLWITVCPMCHTFIHTNPKNSKVMELDRHAQHQAMEKYGWTTKEFVEKFGKNYLEDWKDE